MRVLIADDDDRFAQALNLLLQHDHRIVVVGTARSAREAVELAQASAPDVVLLDLRMPGATRLDTLRRRLVVTPSAQVIVLSGDSTDEVAREATAVGAAAFLTKGEPHFEIAEAVLEVAASSRSRDPTSARSPFRSLALGRSRYPSSIVVVRRVPGAPSSTYRVRRRV